MESLAVASPVAAAPARLDLLCRRLAATLGWKNLGIANGGAIEPFGTTSHDLPLLEVPELTPLLPHFDRILVQCDRVSMVAICIRDRTRPCSRPVDLPNDLLLSVGRSLKRYCNKVYGVRMAAGIEVWEVGSAACEVTHLQNYRPSGHRRGEVHLAAWSLGFDDEEVWTSLPLGGALTLRDHLQQQLFGLAADEPVALPTATASTPAKGRTPIATWGVVAFIAAIFAWQVAHAGGFGFPRQSLYEMGALHIPSVQAGDWLRLLTALFLHGHAVHLVLNLAPLLLAGATLESLLGRGHFLAIFFVSGLAGTTSSFLFNDPRLLSVGASGAVFGLLACALLTVRHLPPGAVRAQMSFQLYWWATPAFLSMLTSGVNDGIDLAAHVGGAFAGALLGAVLARNWQQASLPPPFAKTARVVAVFGSLAVVAAFARVLLQ